MKPARSIFFILPIAATLLIGAGLGLAVDQDAHKRALQAAQEAQKAAQQAQAAQEAVNQAAQAAEQAATLAEQLAYQAYLDMMGDWREDRLAKMPPPPEPPQTNLEVNNPIDAFIVAKWPDEAAFTPCSDEAFIRRVYLDGIGLIPTANEVREFLASEDPDKRSKLIDEVLSRNRDYAIHWSQFWEDALCSNGNHQGGVGTRANFRDFIIESFENNKPYDVFVAQLLDPQAVRYRGGYVQSETHMDSLQTAADIGQVFMGTRMKCASCHDHFLNFEWSQKRFLGFASFFSEENLEVIRCEVKKGEFVPPKFMFDNGAAAPEQLSELEGRLHEVTHLIVDPNNPRFASSLVNRLWKRYTGLGLVEPVDDFREDTPPSHPQLLEWMSYEFAKQGYDVKHMVSLIMNSRTYQQAFDPDRADWHQAGLASERRFESPAHRRLTCEQVLDSIKVAFDIDEKRTAFDATSTPLSRALGRPETRNEPIITRSDEVAVLQALQLLNGETLHTMVYNSPLPKQLAAMNDPDRAVEEAFLRVLSRYPSEQEKGLTLDFLSEATGETAWGDMLWALAVSPEFHYIQ